MLFALLLACSSPTPPDPAPAPAPAPAEAPAPAAPAPIATHMQGHFQDATIGIEAWIRGDFDLASKRLAALGSHEAPAGLDSPEDQDRLKKMRESATAASKGGPAAKVAGDLAALGQACADCHQARSIEPTVSLPEAPAPSRDLKVHMQGHQWAVTALWSAMVASDAALWEQGAARLAAEPLTAQEFGPPEPPPELLAHETAVHDLAAAARKATTQEARTSAFTAIVATCGGCHIDMLGE